MLFKALISGAVSSKGCRFISTSNVPHFKEIIIKKDQAQIVVQGKKIESDRKSLRKPGACPLCAIRLKNLSFHDVLILRQFMYEDGRVMSQASTKLCDKQYELVKKLIHQAQVCRLLKRPDDMYSYGPWDKLNTYFEEQPRLRDRPMELVKPYHWQTYD